jgi:cell division protein FtsQ
VRAQRGASRRVVEHNDWSFDWKQILRPLIVILLVPCFVIAYNSLKQVGNTPIKNVVIQGNIKYLDKAAVQNLLLPHLDLGFFGIKLDEIQNTVHALAWINVVERKRAWPDSLIVTVSEHVPVAHWGGNSLLNGHAEIYSPATIDLQENLPQLSGPEHSQAQVLATYYHFSEVLKPSMLQVVSLNKDGKGAWRAELTNGTTLVFGRNNIDKKLRRFQSLFEHNLKTYQQLITHVDLRYTNGLAVQWRDKQIPEEFVRS